MEHKITIKRYTNINNNSCTMKNKLGNYTDYHKYNVASDIKETVNKKKDYRPYYRGFYIDAIAGYDSMIKASRCVTILYKRYADQDKDVVYFKADTFEDLKRFWVMYCRSNGLHENCIIGIIFNRDDDIKCTLFNTLKKFDNRISKIKDKDKIDQFVDAFLKIYEIVEDSDDEDDSNIDEEKDSPYEETEEATCKKVDNIRRCKCIDQIYEKTKDIVVRERSSFWIQFSIFGDCDETCFEIDQGIDELISLWKDFCKENNINLDDVNILEVDLVLTDEQEDQKNKVYEAISQLIKTMVPDSQTLHEDTAEYRKISDKILTAAIKFIGDEGYQSYFPVIAKEESDDGSGDIVSFVRTHTNTRIKE